MTLSKLIATKISHEDQVELINRLKQEVLSQVQPRALILFGSAIKYEMSNASDLDLVVIVEKSDDIKPTLKALRLTSLKLDWPIDLLVIDEKTFQQREEIGGGSTTLRKRKGFSSLERELAPLLSPHA